MAKKIIFGSGKGGVGKSTLTAGIAASLTALGLNVLVIDFDVGMGCLDLILSADDTGIFNWGDVIDGACEPSAALRETLGPRLLVAPNSFSEEYTEQSVAKLMKYYEDDYDYILFDAPAGVSGGFLLAASCADSGIIVSTPDEVCVRVGNYAADKLFEAGIDDVRLVINRFSKRQTVRGRYLNIDEVIDATLLQLIGVVPEDRGLSYCSIAGLSSLPPKSPGRRAFDRIADRLEGRDVNLVI